MTAKPRNVEYTISSGNVFADLGFPEPDTELIKADPAPYKVRPSNPGGLDIAADSETAFETSAGQDTDGRLDMSKAPAEEATPAPVPPPKPGSAPAAKAAATSPAPPIPAVAAPPPPKPTGGTGSVVQLGAFQNMAQAERAWTALSTRFSSGHTPKSPTCRTHSKHTLSVASNARTSSYIRSMAPWMSPAAQINIFVSLSFDEAKRATTCAIAQRNGSLHDRERAASALAKPWPPHRHAR
mgnify:CR=1 FL=1